MLKFCLFIIVVSLSHELTVGAEDRTKEKIYYKRTKEVQVDANKSLAKDKNVVMEGTAPILKNETAKIKPRKGVLNKLDEKVDQNDTLLLDHLADKPVEEKTDEISAAIELKKPVDILKLVSTTQKSTSTLYTAPVHEKQDANATRKTATKPVKKFNPKPTVTYAEKEADDEAMPPFPTSKSPLGMPRKIDYIVPVIITITALPLLGVAFYVLYKRGRDYWDKRHYRRMDFLIDGMYNE